MNSKQYLGSRGESLAREHLLALGYRIIGANYHTRRGEIDIIAFKKGVLLFVEVKYRTDLSMGYPVEGITKSKLRKLRLAIIEYLGSPAAPSYTELKFDAICILEQPGQELVLDHVEDIFGP